MNVERSRPSTIAGTRKRARRKNQPCTVCVHRERHAIDAALATGESLRSTAKRWGVSSAAVFRHRRDHGGVLPAVEEVERAVQRVQTQVMRGAELNRKVQALAAESVLILKTAKTEKNHDLALKAIREASRTMELLARLTGDLGGPAVNVQVSLSEHPRWQEAMQVITAALEPHPEAKLAVVQALLQADAGRSNE
jgi:hypothetical protein